VSGLLIVGLIILCGCILLAESLVRCIAWSRLGVNGCFVPKADIARNNVAQRKNAIIYNWVGN
ncbi:hypothetical protein ACUNF8_00005, partial [Serratia sp. IR-2025]